MLTLTRCREAFIEAKTLMPGGVNSPVRAAYALNMDPIVVKQAKGAYLTDLDQRSYLDFCMSWGAIILGHAHPYINEALSKQMALGTSYGAVCELEIKLAKRLVTHSPHLEKVRFVSSGTESTMSALRLARGFTGRDKIVKFSGHYHGHHDALLKAAGSFLAQSDVSVSLGVSRAFIQDTLVLPYNDPEVFEHLTPLADQIACVIFEPVCGNMGVVLPTVSFLEALQTFCRQQGVLLIVDEVMTGFRTNFKGATGDFSLQGDLYCYGKIIGGGLPCAFFGGRAEIMDALAPNGGVFQAGTLSGNPLAMAAGLAVTDHLLQEGVYEKLQLKADLLLNPIEAFIKTQALDVTLNRYGSMFTLFLGLPKVACFEDLKTLDQNRFNRFYKRLYQAGLFFSPSAYEANFLSLAHSDEDLIRASKVIIEALCDSSLC
jgi:glutamate-1-semialdehyde 2,1-aminomutase